MKARVPGSWDSRVAEAPADQQGRKVFWARGVYATFVIEKRFGVNTTAWRTFVADRVKAGLLSMILGGTLLAMILSLFEYVNRFPWLYCWVGVAGFMLCIQFFAPRWILPLFNTYSPLANGDLREFPFAAREPIRLYQFDRSRGVGGFPKSPEDLLREYHRG